MEAGVVDQTWIHAQTLFMALNTLLWSLSYSEIRSQHRLEEVKIHIRDSLDSIDQAVERWPGVQSARQLYENLIDGCLKAYEMDASSVVQPPIHRQSSVPANSTAASPSRAASYSPASTAATSFHVPTSPSSFADSYAAVASPEFASATHQVATGIIIPSSSPDFFGAIKPSSQQPLSFLNSQNGFVSQSDVPSIPSYTLPDFDPLTAAFFNPSMNQLPQHWDPNVTSSSVDASFFAPVDTIMHDRPWLGSFGDEYSRYMHETYFPPSQQLPPLSEQQQIELMASLEQDQLPDVSNLVSESTTFYRAHLV